jgi:GR25 family glycosyltransferase involved in LPS biosynthesis
MNNFLVNSYDLNISNCYIIYLSNNDVSKKLSERCLNSCKKINYSATLHEGFDGTGKEIIVPEHLKNESWYKWLKVTDHYQSLAEIACSLSHISLWVKCMELNRPIVILEHDAMMLKPYNTHQIYNGIDYLGCYDQLKNNNFMSNKIIPIFSSINQNWNFINRAHAYSIDPASARKLFSNVLTRGIFESADVMIRADDVAIIQTGLYAYDLPGETTIKTRKK